MKKILLSLFALAGLAACSKDTVDNNVAPMPDGSEVNLIIKASTDAATRVVSEDGLNFNFVEGDAFGVYFYNANIGDGKSALENILFNAEGTSEEGEFALVKDASESLWNTDAILKQSGTLIFGYTPYTDSDVTVNGGVEGVAPRNTAIAGTTRAFNLAATQKQAAAGDVAHIAANYVMAAQPAAPVKDDENTYTVDLSFSGIYSIVRFQLKNETGEEITINKMRLTAEGKQLTGVFEADLTLNPKFANTEYALKAIEGKTNDYVEVELETPATVAANGEVMLYALVNASEVVNPVMTVEATSGEFTYLYTKDVFANGQAIPLFRAERSTLLMRLNTENRKLQDSETVIVIDNVEKLQKLADDINGGDTKKGMTVVLTENLDLGGMEWTPMGDVLNYPSYTFAGTFDGNGKTISNFKTVANDNAIAANGDNVDAQGLFGSITGVVKNLTVDNAQINSYHYAGAICGFSSANVGMKIENCHVTNSTITTNVWTRHDNGNFDNGDKAGGVIGYMVAGDTVEGCSVRNTTINGYRDLGGIVGCSAGNVTKCTVGENVKIFVDATNNYKNYTVDTFTVDHIAGRKENGYTPAENSGEVSTIEFNLAEGLKYVVTNVAGVSTKEYQISSAQGLVNANDMLFPNVKGEYFKLTDDIVMTNIDWASKIPATGYFTFDGNGFDIRGWSTTTGKALLAPTFRPAGDVTIKNLKLEKCSVEYNPTDAETAVGLLAGWCEIHTASTTVTIENCRLYNCKIESNANFGGAYIGWAGGAGTLNIKGSSTILTTVSAGGSVGGIIGYDYMVTTVEDCAVRQNTFTSADNGDWRVGAIAGTVQANLSKYFNNRIPALSENKANTYTQANSSGNSDAKKTYGNNDVCNYAFGRYAASGEFYVEGKKIILGGAYDPATGEYYASGKTALANAIGLGATKVILAAGEYDFAAPKGGDLQIVGLSTDATILVPQAYGCNGTNLTFDNVTLDVKRSTDYLGFQHTGAVTYNGCVIKGGHMTCYSPLSTWTTFNECEFVQDVYDYHLWTYHSNVKFEKCTFNCVGKAVKVYAEGDIAEVKTVILNECKFINNGEAKKAAVEIDARYTPFEVYINGCTEQGFAQGEFTTSTMYNLEGSNWKLYVDDVEVTE